MAVTKKSTEATPTSRPNIKTKTATVRLIVELTGTRNGDDWPPRGVPFDLPAGEAEDLIAGGMAVLVEKVERATATPPENAAG